MQQQKKRKKKCKHLKHKIPTEVNIVNDFHSLPAE